MIQETQIQVLSDLHLEAPVGYDIFEITPMAPNLALLGDIGQAKDEGYAEFIKSQVQKFQTIFLVLGNHEVYHSDWASIKQSIDNLQKEKLCGEGKLILLDQTRVDISSTTTVLGCTLFSKINPEFEDEISFGVNDFYYVGEGWNTALHNQAHDSDLQWLNQQVEQIGVEEPHRSVIIFTHHSPTTDTEAVNPRHAKSIIRSAFSTDLSGEKCWTSKNVKVWAFGHTHYNCDFVDEKTGKRVFANQRGYYRAQSVGFDIDKVVDTALIDS